MKPVHKRTRTDPPVGGELKTSGSKKTWGFSRRGWTGYTTIKYLKIIVLNPHVLQTQPSLQARRSQTRIEKYGGMIII